MNTHTASLLACVAVTAFAPILGATALPPTHFSSGAAEIRGYADLDGDGRADAVVVDRATGALRAGFQLDNSGTLAWTPAHAAGIYGVTSVTAGRLLNSTRDALAVTAPSAGRINLVDLPSPGALAAITVHMPQATGPLSLAAGQLAGTSALEDLLLLSQDNPSPGNRTEYFANAGSGNFTFVAKITSSDTTRNDRAARVLLSVGGGQEAAMLFSNDTTATLVVVDMDAPGSPVVLTVPGLDPAAQYLLNPFDGTHAQLVTWIPGSTQYEVRQVSFNGASYSAAAPVTVGVPFAFRIGQMFSIPAGAQARLLIVDQDGVNVLVRSSGTGADLQSFRFRRADRVTGAVPLPGGADGFQLLTGPQPDGRSTRSYGYAFSGGSYAETGVADLAPVTATSGAGHVLVYQNEPFASADARLLERRRALDWSSSPSIGTNVQVSGEVFADPQSGLSFPTPLDLGAAPALATHVVASQYTPEISVFALSPAGGADFGSLRATPLPGTYGAAVALELQGPAGWDIRYRTSVQGPFQLYAGPVLLHRDSTVQAYAIVAGGTDRTPLFSGEYRFTVPAGELSSLGDGVPDFVKIGRGFDPRQLPERSSEVHGGEANYLQILLEDAGYPVSRRHTSGTALDLHVRPLSHDGVASQAVPSALPGAALPDGSRNPGNSIRVFDVSGEPLDQAAVQDFSFFGAGQTTARLDGIGRAGRASLAVSASLASFGLDFIPPYEPGSHQIGRELAGLTAIPEAGLSPFSHTYGGGDDATEAAAWLAAAAAHYTATPPPAYGATLDPLETTVLLVFEQWVARRLVERGQLPGSYWPARGGSLPPDRLTLTPFRAGERAQLPADLPTATGLIAITPELLSGLQDYKSLADPGHRLTDVLELIRAALRGSGAPDTAALRALTGEVYRISARWGGLFPGAFRSPVDVLREFLAGGIMPVAYTNDWDVLPAEFGGALTPLGPADYAAALSGFDALLALPQARPVATRALRVTTGSNSPGCSVFSRVDTSVDVALVDAFGEPFRFPGGFEMPVGTELTVTGYTDLTPGPCAPQILEVISTGTDYLAFVTAIPLPSAIDADGNLLDDGWELLLFGQTGNDPYGTLPGGHTLLQVFLDGTDPFNPLSYGNVPVAAIGPVNASISRSGNQLSVKWDFPPQYADHFHFAVQYSDQLGSTWFDVPGTILHDGHGNFQLQVSFVPGGKRFWKVAYTLQ